MMTKSNQYSTISESQVRVLAVHEKRRPLVRHYKTGRSRMWSLYMNVHCSYSARTQQEVLYRAQCSTSHYRLQTCEMYQERLYSLEVEGRVYSLALAKSNRHGNRGAGRFCRHAQARRSPPTRLEQAAALQSATSCLNRMHIMTMSQS